MPDFVTIDTGEVRIRAAIQGDGPLVILVHGFPESWWSWRHQIGPIADAGYKVAAIDVRGYGGSDKPPAVDAYGLQELSEDVSQVRQALQPNSPAILVGHDWGAPIVWTTALTRPDEFSAVAGLSVPWSGVPTRPFSDIYTETFTSRGQFFYQAWLQNVGPAEAEAERDVRGFLRKFYYALSGDAPQGTWPQKRHGASLLEGLADPTAFPAWLSPSDLDYYVSEFERSGFRGPMNRYRNHERDFAWLQAFKGRRIEQPSLLIGGDRDIAFTLFGFAPDPEGLMRQHASDLRGVHTLAATGHWTQQERPAEVTKHLLDWLAGL